MNDVEMKAIVSAIEEHNRAELGLLAKAALLQELPEMEFQPTLERMVERAKIERFVNPCDILGARPETKAGKYDAADAAWAEITRIASQGDGIVALLGDLDSVQWKDPTAKWAFVEIRQTIKKESEEKALWEFRTVYNRIKEASLEPAAEPVAVLAAPSEPVAEIRQPRAEQPQKMDVHAEVASMKEFLSGVKEQTYGDRVEV